MAAPAGSRPQRTLLQLVEKLEATKPKAGLVDPATDFALCRDFALGVYARADRADRSGRVDARQVEAFSAAGTFLKALTHFGALDADLTSRQQYAEWRAWDLATAIQSGRPPARVDTSVDGPPRDDAAPTHRGATTDLGSIVAPAPDDCRSLDAAARVDSEDGRARGGTASTAAGRLSDRSPPSPPSSSSSSSDGRHASTFTSPSLDSLSLHAPPPPPPPPRDPSSNGPAVPHRWEPRWGAGGPFAAGDRALYSSATGEWKLAEVLSADLGVVPAAYVVRVDGAERHTEERRLARPPDPSEATATATSAAVGLHGGEGDDVAEGGRRSSGAEGTSTSPPPFTPTAPHLAPRESEPGLPPPTPPPPPPPDGSDGSAPPPVPSGQPGSPHQPGGPPEATEVSERAMAEAHEWAMEAAGLLAPHVGDHAAAAGFLRKALAALERGALPRDAS